MLRILARYAQSLSAETNTFKSAHGSIIRGVFILSLLLLSSPLADSAEAQSPGLMHMGYSMMHGQYDPVQRARDDSPFLDLCCDMIDPFVEFTEYQAEQLEEFCAARTEELCAIGAQLGEGLKECISRAGDIVCGTMSDAIWDSMRRR